MKLLANAETESTLYVETSKNITLDLNGYNLALKSGATGSVISVNGGTFTLNDGKGGGTVTGGNTSTGGGVYIVSGGTFNMNGGTVSGNTASKDGGGIYVSQGTFNMNGGTISGNTASKGGGGVWCSGEFNIKGKIDISGNTAQDTKNVQFDSISIITVVGELAEGAKIYLNRLGSVVEGFTTHNPNKNPSEFFICENPNFPCVYIRQGYVAIGEHKGGTATCQAEAVCTNNGCGKSYGDKGGHIYGEPSYSWSGNDCTATRVCKYHDTEKETETVTATEEITVATCTRKGSKKLTATFTNSAYFEKQTSTEEIDALGHNFTDTDGWVWADDGKTVKLTLSCTRSGCGHSIERSPEVESAQITPPSCTVPGETKYTSSYTIDKTADNSKQEQTFTAPYATRSDIPATGHVFANRECTKCGAKEQIYWGVSYSGILIVTADENDEDLADIIEADRKGSFDYDAAGGTRWNSKMQLILKAKIKHGVAPLSTRQWFASLMNLETVDLTGLDASNVTDMSYMFMNCSKLTSLDLSSVNTAAVSKMTGMFIGCSELTSVDLSSFDTAAVDDMSLMFDNCKKLTSLDLSSFDMANVKTTGNMFNFCRELTSIKFPAASGACKTTATNNMFSHCEKLISLDLSLFNLSNVTNVQNMLAGCNKLETLKTPGVVGTLAADLPAKF